MFYKSKSKNVSSQVSAAQKKSCYHEHMPSRLQHWLLPHQGNQQRPVLIQSRGFLLVSMIIGVWSLVLFAALRLPQLHQILGYGSQITVPQVLTETNKQRTQQQLPSLVIDEKLSQAAHAKAQDMFAQQYWAHTSPNGTQPWDFIKNSGYRYSIAGENLAKNFTQTDTMMNAWMNSPTHKANIISPNYTQTGIAVLEGELNGVETTLVVQMFGKPEGTALAQQNDEPSAPTSVSPTESTGAIAGETDSREQEELPAPDRIEPTDAFSETALHPLATPLTLYRLGILTVLGILLAVLAHDLWLAQQNKLQRHVGRNLAHMVVILAVIITLALAQTGKLL